MTITYRDATPADAAILDGIFESSFCDTFAHLYRREDLDAFLSGFGLGDWEEQFGNPTYAFRIGESDGEPAGYLKLGPMKLPFATVRPALLIDQVYVLTKYHGAGIARGLMDWALAEARAFGADEIQLSVWSGNEGAQRFYERYGFERVADIDFWVGQQRDDEFLFAKML